jgi:hypothetical protein
MRLETIFDTASGEAALAGLPTTIIESFRYRGGLAQTVLECIDRNLIE